MGKLLERIKGMVLNRRHVSATVEIDRRSHKPTLKDADQVLREAMEKLERTATLRRDDFYDRMNRK